MALVPHKVTALAESDADGTDGKNIVSGAVVSLFDTTGAAVTLFDDEAGNNGSTAKQTDSSGQVVVWVTPGEYSESVNGSTQRAVTIGGRTVTSYPNTESMQNSRPTQTGQRAENRERGLAQYELQPSVYSLQSGDIVAANGRVWALIVNDGKFHIRHFGAKVDGATDDSQAINNASERASLVGGDVLFPDGTAVISSPIIIYTENSRQRGYRFKGISPELSIIKMANGANINMFVDQRWNEDSAFSSGNVRFNSLTIDGNKANNTIGSCVVAKPYFWEYENVWVKNAPEKGILHTAVNSGGSVSTAGGDCKFINCKMVFCNEEGFCAIDSTSNTIADHFFNNVIIAGNGSSGTDQFYADRASGFVFDTVRFFSGHYSDVRMGRVDGVIMSSIHMDTDGDSAVSGDSIYSIKIDSFSNNGTFTVSSSYFKVRPNTPKAGVDINVLRVMSGLGCIDFDATLDQDTDGNLAAFVAPNLSPRGSISATFNGYTSDLKGNLYFELTKDIERGVFTPSIALATQGDFSPTYTLQSGEYTVIGGMVTVFGRVDFNTNAYTTGGGDLKITGLPFEVKSDNGQFFYPGSVTTDNVDTVAGCVNMSVMGIKGSDEAYITCSIDAGARTNLKSFNIPASTSGFKIFFSVSYPIV